MAEEQQIRTGQVWRRKRNGRLIRIVGANVHDDWRWEGHDYTGRGVSYGCYIRRDCELVKDVER